MKATSPSRDWTAPRGACECCGCETSRQIRAAIYLAEKDEP